MPWCAAFGVIQLAFLGRSSGDVQIFSDFDQGLLFQACTMAMVALGLNLIYGFNGQFSLAQWGFYGIGAYCAADITYRWTNGDARGLLVVGVGVVLVGLVILGVRRFLQQYTRRPGAVRLHLLPDRQRRGRGGRGRHRQTSGTPSLAPLFGTPAEHRARCIAHWSFRSSSSSPCFWRVSFAAEVSFLFGLPVLTLGSDYFGIATLGFAIVVKTLMVNSDTILPFPEMKGGRGMIGIPKLTTWFWAFVFLLARDRDDAQPHPIQHGPRHPVGAGGRDRGQSHGHRRREQQAAGVRRGQLLRRDRRRACMPITSDS